MMRTVRLPDGTEVPALGLGTWHMGERGGAAKAEVAAVKLGIELGMTLIDTAEMYGNGGAEEVVAEASQGQRDKLFIVSKVYPQNASRTGVPAACERSLKRLRTDRIDLYLLHWRGSHPLAETVEAFEALRAAGKIRYWGVSNFDTRDMQELVRLPGGAHCASNQVLYHVGSRGIEYDLLPWCTEHKIPLMAYSPLGQGGRLLQSKALAAVAKRHNATPAQIAIAWTMRHGNVISIPKASDLRHVRENAAAGAITLSDEDLATIDAVHPAPGAQAVARYFVALLSFTACANRAPAGDAVVLTLLAILVAALVVLAPVAGLVPRIAATAGAAGICALVVVLAVVVLASGAGAATLAVPIGPPGASMHLALDPLAASFLLLLFLVMPCAETAPLPLAAMAITVLAGDGFTLAVGLLLLGGVGSLRSTAAAAVCLTRGIRPCGPGGVRRTARHAAGRLERGRGAAAGPCGRRGDQPGQPADRGLSGAPGAVRPLRRGTADVVGCAAAAGGRRHRRDRIAARGTRGHAARSAVVRFAASVRDGGDGARRGAVRAPGRSAVGRHRRRSRRRGWRWSATCCAGRCCCGAPKRWRAVPARAGSTAWGD